MSDPSPGPSSPAQQLQTAIDRLQQAVLTNGYLKRTHEAAAADLMAVHQALTEAIGALRTLQIGRQ